MPTLLQLIQQLNTAPPGLEADEDAEVDDWTRLRPDWPPFESPRALPKHGPTLEWLWKVLWPGDGLYEPDAGELAHAAQVSDERHPQSHETRARQANPNWLAETLAFAREQASLIRWQRIEMLLDADPANDDGWSETDQRRIAWLRKHAALVRPVVEAARGEHLRCYGTDRLMG